MSSLTDKICRARWFANQHRYGEACETLMRAHLPDDASVEELVMYYGMRGAFQVPARDLPLAIGDMRRALETATFHRLPDDLFIWLTRYNLGLALVLNHRPIPGVVQSINNQRHLEEAVSILGVTAEALRNITGVLLHHDRRSGVTLALVAETLYMLGRYEEAVFYAREAVPRLKDGTAVALVARRLDGCYAILAATVAGWQCPAGYSTSARVGQINAEEIDNCRTVPELHARADIA